MRIDGKAVFPFGARFLPYQPKGDNLLKLAFTRLLDGCKAAFMERSAAMPFSIDGVLPEKISGQNCAADCIKDICAAKTPSAMADVFSLTARSVSEPVVRPLLASAAISGRRNKATIGANMRSPAIDVDCRALLRCLAI